MKTLYLTDNLQAILDYSPPGEHFQFAPGSFRLPAGLRPRDRQVFYGQNGVILTGAGVTPCAFEGLGTGKGVHIHGDGMIVEQFMPGSQCAAIGNTNPQSDPDFMRDWLVKSVEARYNTGRGLTLGSGCVAKHNDLHHNGQLGLGGRGDNIKVVSNHIWANNTAGTDVTWEAGGAKFTVCKGLTVKHNWVHDNVGPGLWDDVGCKDVLYEQNIVFDNLFGGITHEIGYQATIRWNNIGRNRGESGPEWGDQILVFNSQDTEVYGNTVTVGSDAGNGIQLVHKLRQGYSTRNVHVYDNDVTHTRSPQGVSALLTDASVDVATRNAFLAQWGNSFNRNRYHVTDPNAAHWWVIDHYVNWSGWQAAGMDAAGSVWKI